MEKEDIELLEDNGWIVVCESPFEIEDEAGADVGFASGSAAQGILNYLKYRM